MLASFNKQFPRVKVIGEEGQKVEDLDWIASDWIVETQSKEVLATSINFPDQLRNVDVADVTVWVDPLDGTAEFTQGLLDHVTVLIGGASCFYFLSFFMCNKLQLR